MPRRRIIAAGRTYRVRVPYWCAVRVPIGREKFARLNIEKEGNRTFMPRIKAGFSPILTPLFPGYIFALVEDHQWVHLRYSRGVINLVMDGSKPARIRENEISQMLKAQGEDGYIDLSPPTFEPQVGDKIKVKVGLFKEHIASYVGLTPENRIRAIIDFMGKPQELTLRKREIEQA